MIRREVLFPQEIIDEVCRLVDQETYILLRPCFPKGQISSAFLSQEQAEALITLAVIEKKKAQLKYPFYDDEHPQYDEIHETKFDDVQMGFYEKVIY